jgi:hypothetical protein
MNSANDSTQKSIELMISIRTLEDLKKNKKEIITTIEKFVIHGVESLKNIIKLSLSPEETKKELDKFQRNQEHFNEAWEAEMNRISDIEGAKEFLEGLKDEMEIHMEPYAKELAETMGEIMNSMMGQFINGLGDTK